MNNFRQGQVYIVSRMKNLKDTWEANADLKKNRSSRNLKTYNTLQKSR